MGNSPEKPSVEKESEDMTSQTGLQIGCSGMQGWRSDMEDQHLALDIGPKKDHTFVAVFDGHGGAGAAIFAAQNIVMEIERAPEWEEYHKSGATDSKLLGCALTRAFKNIDVSLRAHQDSLNGQDTSGCTSVTAMITPQYIICSNAGDSRCVLGA
jgi:serine/threonine protein phosphatase PrpC